MPHSGRRARRDERAICATRWRGERSEPRRSPGTSDRGAGILRRSEPWPELQRFDFVVRKRRLTESEAKELKGTLKANANPYARTALAALRELTGRDAGVTAAEWRRALAQ